MLKILNLKKKEHKNNNKIKLVSNVNEFSEVRHYPPANKEWFNSIYSYNKDTSKLLPSADKVIFRLIKSYFNLYSKKLEKKTRSRRLATRFRKLSTNRILVSKAELKHTNDKVVITVYLYNRQKRYLLERLKKINIIFSLIKLSEKDGEKMMLKKKIDNIILTRKILRNVKNKVKMVMLKFLREKKIFFTKPSFAEIPSEKIKLTENKYLKNLVSKSLDEEMLSLYSEQILFLNKSKLNNTYLRPFINLIKKVYKKNVEFNLVNLKYLHLNSYIFTETLVTKLRNKKNRLLKVLNLALFKFKLPIENKLATFDEIYNTSKTKQNLKLNNFSNDPLFKTDLENKDILQKMLHKISVKDFFISEKDKLSEASGLDVKKDQVTKTILDLIKYKFVSGLRIEAAGRLTRRNTAARALFKLRYKGNIRNLDSSYKGLSSVVIRGHAKPNVQYTKLKSKLRIGSFGIKGWVSSN